MQVLSPDSYVFVICRVRTRNLVCRNLIIILCTGNEIIVRFFVNASHIYILLLITAFDEESTVDSFVWTGLWDLWYSVFQTLTSPSGHRQRKDSPSIEAASQSRYDVSIVCRYHRYRQQLLLLSTNPNVWKPFSVLNIFTFQTDISIYFKLSIRNRNCLIE